MTFIFYYKTKPVYHRIGKFSPVIGTLTVPFPNRICPIKNFISSLRSKKLTILNYIPQTFSIGFISAPLAGHGRSSKSGLPSNQYLIILAHWIGDLSCTNGTRIPGNLMWTEGRTVSPRISRYFSAVNVPWMRTKSPAPLAENQAKTGTDFLPLRSLIWTWFLSKRVPSRRYTNTRPHSSDLAFNK